MKSLLILVAVVCLAVPACAPAPEPPAEEDPGNEADISAINEIWEKYAEAENTGDAELWISLWTNDGVRMSPNRPAVTGTEHVRSQIQSLFDRYSIEIAISNEEVKVAGDWAYSRGIYTATLTPKAGGDPSEESGKYLTILERQGDGSWKIARDCFNSN